MAAFFEELIRGSWLEEPDEDDENPYLTAVYQRYTRNTVGLVPGASIVANRYGSGIPVVDSVQAVPEAFDRWSSMREDLVEDGYVDGEKAGKTVRETLKSIGILIGFPGTIQIDRGVKTYMEDDDPNLPKALVTGPDDDN
jgi:hypothetical protein